MIPRRGATVAGITQKHLSDVLEIRKALEDLAIELACQRMSNETREELEEMQNKFKANMDSTDSLMLANLDEKFHETIYHSTNNERLVTMLANLREQMYRYRLEYIKDKDKRNQLVSEHDRILKAIKLRHVVEAKQAIREHIDNQEITVLKSSGE